MDHTMVLSYDYSNQNRRRWQTNAPLSRWWQWRCASAIWSASPDAAWQWLHQKPLDAAIGWLLAPYFPIGRQGGNQLNDDATCTHFAGLFDGHHDVAVLHHVHRPMRRFVAFIEATKCHHRTSTRSNSIKPDTPTPVVSDISSWKRVPVDMLDPNNNKGMTCQTNEKHLTIFPEYFVGVVKLAINRYSNRFLFCVFTKNLLQCL